jgi:capsular exopolysaccharide synthesis family protein
MDTIDRPDSNVPARYPADSPRTPAGIAAMSRDLAVATPAPAPPQVTPRVILRGLSRHWWRIMLFWLVLSAPLIYLIYALVEPTYEASSLLRAEPTAVDPYNPGQRGGSSLVEVRPYLETQVQLITSDRVLDVAIAKPEISNLEMIRSSKDPKADLRGEMKVEIVGHNTYLIKVSLSSRDPVEAAKIVNAVVDTHIEQHTSYQQTSNRKLKLQLENELDKLGKQIQARHDELGQLVSKANIPMDKLLKPKPAGQEDEGPSFKSVPESTYTSAAGKLFDTDVQLIEKQAELAVAKAQLERAQALAAEGSQRAPSEDAQLEARIEEEFKKDPDAQPLIDQIHDAKDAQSSARRKARQPGDAAVVHADRQYKELLKQWGELWAQKHDEIKERLQAGGEAEDLRPAVWMAKVADIEAEIEKLRKKRTDMRAMIDKLEVTNKTQNTEQLQAQKLTQDLAYFRRLHEAVKQRLGQLEFEIGQEAYRIDVQDKASVPRVPSNNKRWKYVFAAPAGLLAFMLCLFLLVEVKAERVADPDALSTRVQSEVYALPPLPTARSIRKRVPADSDDQIDQFIQRLDHLRFAVCGTPTELEKGRCVLITSSIGGEGKTTLAAQLAARCGHAGMSTLLIDADLRRSSLCSLLDIPEGPGLSDALVSDDPAPTELVIPVQGGTFHLLPAGTPVADASRTLQSRELGLLIARFRQLYDLVIIDSPPVLPVPDALILGRWVDGAVIAVRYDISRFPQVERARRQLDGAGIPVLGTVINGMKNSESYYGRYSYGRRRSPQADSPATI